MIARAVLVLAATLVGLVVAEAGLRWSTDDAFISPSQGDEGWIEHPFLPFIGKPNARIERNIVELGLHILVQNNSAGFRAHEFPTEKGPDDFVIVCLGGSTTWGEAAESNDEVWPEILERLLAERFPDRNIRVFNLGVPNADSIYSIVLLSLIGIHLEPDLVIDYDGWNDIKPGLSRGYRLDHAHYWNAFDPDSIGVVQRFLPAWILRVRLIALLTQTLEEWFGLTDLRSYVVDESSRAWFPDRTLNTQRTLNNLLTIHSIARGHGARTIFSTVQIFDGADFDAPSMANGPQSRSEMFRRFFETNGFLYVDQDRLIPDGDRSIQVDPVHFTAKGSMMMARNYFDYIVAKDLIPE